MESGERPRPPGRGPKARDAVLAATLAELADTGYAALTIDIEDYYHVSAFDAVIQRADWDTMQSRVEANTHRLLAILARHAVRATFFVLGWVAERYPELVRTIHAVYPSRANLPAKVRSFVDALTTLVEPVSPARAR